MTNKFAQSDFTCSANFFINQPVTRRLNGVNRQPSKGQKFNRQPSKKQLLLGVKRFSGLSNLTISVHFSCSSWNAGFRRIVFFFPVTASFHVPKYTHFTIFSTHLQLLNWHYNWLLSGSISVFKQKKLILTLTVGRNFLLITINRRKP